MSESQVKWIVAEAGNDQYYIRTDDIVAFSLKRLGSGYTLLIPKEGIIFSHRTMISDPKTLIDYLQETLGTEIVIAFAERKLKEMET